MLTKLKQTKTKLMKDRRDANDTLKHQITLQINGINTVLTEAKNYAVKHKLPSEELLTLENQVDVLKAVLKALDKEIAAYAAEHRYDKSVNIYRFMCYLTITLSTS